MIHRISHKDTDDLVIKTLKSDMNTGMKIEQIDGTQTIWSFKKDSGNRKSRPIIKNIVQYDDIGNVVIIKLLKGKNILITKSLTKERMNKEQYRFKQVWIIDRKIVDDDSPSTKSKVCYE